MSHLEQSRDTARILCLHGMGSSSEIFEAQTAALRYKLGDRYEYEFVDGSHPCSPAKGIRNLFGEHHLCYSYYDGSAESARSAVDDLSDFVDDEGPFDVVLGFSLGAALAATLLLRHTQSASSPPFRSAIFFCGFEPVDWPELCRGILVPAELKCASPLLEIPTVHIWSDQDVELSGRSARLVEFCEPARRKEVIHSAGHSIPSHGQDLARIVTAIEALMDEIKQDET